MKVPVLWISRYDHILARGYADQGMFERILDRDLWRPIDAIEFEHYEVRSDFPDVQGALVVLPARHHASREDVDWFKEQLSRLRWSVVLLAGDEEWVFPWREIEESDTRRVWVMQPRTEHKELSGLIPGGWYPGTREAVVKHKEQADNRTLHWFFAGQVTHERRYQCIRALKGLRSGLLHQTDGYLRGMPQEEYWKILCGSKVVPSPSGPYTVDTARPLEALEAGCVPVVDLVTPRGVQDDYWTLVFGNDCPLRGIRDWREFRRFLANILSQWQLESNRVFAWWQSWKRKISIQLDDDIRAVANTPRQLTTPESKITAIVTTSPIPSHPSTEIIEETITSIRTQLPTSEIIIAIDGVRPEQQERTEDYLEYVRRLLWLCNNKWRNVLPVIATQWLHQAGITKLAFQYVQTPLILFVEHDTPLVGEIAWAPLCEFVQSGQANLVRLHHEAEMLPVHRGIMIDRVSKTIKTSEGDVAARRTFAWWQRPHLASADFYRYSVLSIFADDSRTMIEDVMYGILHNAFQDYNVAGWSKWKVWIYDPGTSDIKRSTHLDGRGEDPKFSMHWEYAGEVPEGAPNPTVMQ